MGHKWVDVTERMGASVTSGKSGVEMVIFLRDIESGGEKGLFFVDSEGLYPLNKKACVHVTTEHDRQYAYLLKQPSGNLKHLIDESEWRLSTPVGSLFGGSLSITQATLEHKVPAPEWEEITSECRPVLVKSASSNGFYVKLVRRNKLIALLGAYKGGVLMAEGTASKYKVQAAKGATISFHVFMKNND